MTDTPRSMPPGGSRKRARSAAEIEAVAARFAGSWVAGDSVQTWLNWHEGRLGELSELLFRGWSWADIGLALFRAGICYGTGRPIPASTLQVKASQARGKARRQREAEARHPAPARPIEVAPASPPPLSGPVAPVLTQPPAPSPSPAPAVGPPPQPARRTPQEVDALIARLLGKKPATALVNRRPVAAEPPRTAAASDRGATDAARGLPGVAAPAEPDAKGPEKPKPASNAADYWRSIGKGRPGS